MSEGPLRQAAVPAGAGGSGLHVVATAGHIDHGKSSLVLRITGIDPDRLVEEKRRGLTIDLGFAWATLPSGREIGFVDVPGHERFIGNMLAGVGPVRLVLFVVAADEGWKPQSEEHLQIVDVLGVAGMVVALTKCDLVDGPTRASRTDEVRTRLQGARLADATIVSCSSRTGEGLEELLGALDDMFGGAATPESSGRPRQFIDRAFTIKGAGTVVTGTLTGGPLVVGAEAEILPSGHRARIRGLQTHKRSLERARPVSRVAVNLSTTPKKKLVRGDVLVMPGQWRPTSVFDAALWPVRGLASPLSARGAYKMHVGSAEGEVRVRFHTESGSLMPGRDIAFARLTISRALALDVHDRFVLRDTGRRHTVAGGEVLDVEPPRKWDERHLAALSARREATDRGALAQLLVDEHGIVQAADVPVLTGSDTSVVLQLGAVGLGAWIASAGRLEEIAASLDQRLRIEHQLRPLSPGLELAEARVYLARLHPLLADPALADRVLEHIVSKGAVARTGTSLRLPAHRASTAGREDADRLVAAVESGGASPPTVKELMDLGFDRELINAACAEGRLVRVSPEIVMTPGFVARARESVDAAGGRGITVSAFREALGTTRKYAVPLLEHFDSQGVTLRQGDRRVPRR